MADKRVKRQWRTVNGQQECTCSSCGQFYPATRQHFYFQGRAGCNGPHSWCKPCYATNLGRGPGAMRAAPAPLEVPSIPYIGPAFEHGPLVPSLGLAVAA
jgi:hypothetical protein